jgi:hypothetical protein
MVGLHKIGGLEAKLIPAAGGRLGAQFLPTEASRFRCGPDRGASTARLLNLTV